MARTTALTPDEMAQWAKLAPAGYRAADQDPRTVFRALYGQDTRPGSEDEPPVSLRSLFTKLRK